MAHSSPIEWPRALATAGLVTSLCPEIVWSAFRLCTAPAWNCVVAGGVAQHELDGVRALRAVGADPAVEVVAVAEGCAGLPGQARGRRVGHAHGLVVVRVRDHDRSVDPAVGERPAEGAVLAAARVVGREPVVAERALQQGERLDRGGDVGGRRRHHPGAERVAGQVDAPIGCGRVDLVDQRRDPVGPDVTGAGLHRVVGHRVEHLAPERRPGLAEQPGAGSSRRPGGRAPRRGPRPPGAPVRRDVVADVRRPRPGPRRTLPRPPRCAGRPGRDPRRHRPQRSGAGRRSRVASRNAARPSAVSRRPARSVRRAARSGSSTDAAIAEVKRRQVIAHRHPTAGDLVLVGPAHRRPQDPDDGGPRRRARRDQVGQVVGQVRVEPLGRADVVVPAVGQHQDIGGLHAVEHRQGGGDLAGVGDVAVLGELHGGVGQLHGDSSLQRLQGAHGIEHPGALEGRAPGRGRSPRRSAPP